jgi:hypothetical protein
MEGAPCITIVLLFLAISLIWMIHFDDLMISILFKVLVLVVFVVVVFFITYRIVT